jgi:hypothetical protein
LSAYHGPIAAGRAKGHAAASVFFDVPGQDDVRASGDRPIRTDLDAAVAEPRDLCEESVGFNDATVANVAVLTGAEDSRWDLVERETLLADPDRVAGVRHLR